jgi:hypothetical protein
MCTYHPVDITSHLIASVVDLDAASVVQPIAMLVFFRLVEHPAATISLLLHDVSLMITRVEYLARDCSYQTIRFSL